MNLLFIPELFYQITTNLDDKEKIFLISCSKIIYNFKSLLILDSEYDLEEINDKWRVKNILIKDFSLENKIKELLKDLTPKLIDADSKYVKFVSNNVNIKLFLNENTIAQINSYGYPYSELITMIKSSANFSHYQYQWDLFMMSLINPKRRQR